MCVRRVGMSARVGVGIIGAEFQRARNKKYESVIGRIVNNVEL